MSKTSALLALALPLPLLMGAARLASADPGDVLRQCSARKPQAALQLLWRPASIPVDTSLPTNPAFRRIHARVQDFLLGPGPTVSLQRGGATLVVRLSFP